MTKKELCELYIEVSLAVSRKEEALSNAFESLNEDNMVLSVIPDELRKFTEELFILAVGESNQDWTDYWLYECDAKNPTTITIDDKEYDVTSFDELWVLVGED